MVLIKEMERQQEEADTGGGQGMPAQNSHPSAGQSVQGQTTQYVNENA